MSQSNSFGPRQNPHLKTQALPSKNQVLQWVASLLPSSSHQFTIQSLGSGEVYCAIMNRYFHGTILSNKIIASPINEYEYSLNLKEFQKSLTKAKLNINFDIQKVSKQKFSENWTLIASLYRVLQGIQPINDNKDIKTPKRQQKSSQLSEIKRENVKQQNTKIPNDVKKNMQVFENGSILSQIERVKQILLSSTNDPYKVIMIRKLFGIQEVKVEEMEVADMYRPVRTLSRDSQ